MDAHYSWRKAAQIVSAIFCLLLVLGCDKSSAFEKWWFRVCPKDSQTETNDSEMTPYISAALDKYDCQSQFQAFLANRHLQRIAEQHPIHSTNVP